MSRLDEILKLREGGMTLQAIGRKFRITKERVRQIIHKPPPSVKMQDFKEMLTPGEAAQLLGVHINTMRRWSDEGVLPSYHLGSRRDRRFRRVDIELYLKQHKQ